ncbi:hypothetical protein CSQ94_04910 [Janthinobacterium sp. BJB312]|nr:hypothetical protein CSQ94_04910 [Janthinobacterium sp. BJB312]
MKKRYAYSYSILRYVHDVATSEFVNIGVALHSHDAGFFEVRCRPTHHRRISEFFPDLNTKAFRSLVRMVSNRFKATGSVYANSLDIPPSNDDLEALLRSVVPQDDSALAWSTIASGISADLDATLSKLFSRYVTKYDHAAPIHKRTDEDVWKNFSRALENRHIAEYFTEKVIEGADDKVKFHSAWKNGIWHCVEPMSFDLAAPDSIKEKARLFLGHMASVADAQEDFKLYLVLGKPTDNELLPAFEKAVQILKKVNVEQEIYTESETDELAARLQQQISRHEHEVG